MISFEEFKKMDLRTARITAVRDHPNADKLYILQIEVGGETKQIVAGIRAQYGAGELVGRSVIVINNLESATIRGEESNGMLLAANDNGNPVILMPEKDVPPGTPIT